MTEAPESEAKGQNAPSSVLAKVGTKRVERRSLGVVILSRSRRQRFTQIAIQAIDYTG
jgi:hypothetical protein